MQYLKYRRTILQPCLGYVLNLLLDDGLLAAHHFVDLKNSSRHFDSNMQHAIDSNDQTDSN